MSRADELPFDPLAALPGWRETVSSAEEFAVRTRADGADPEGAHEAANFCRRYISDVRPAAVQELLELLTP
jgi:hypothetical protein